MGEILLPVFEELREEYIKDPNKFIVDMG